MNVLGIDTGERTGVSLFQGGVLARALTCSHEEFFQQVWIHEFCLGSTHKAGTPLHVQIERPVYYPHGRNKTDVDDLLGLAIKAGEMRRFFIVYGCTDVHLLRPADWKGQLPDDVCRRRIEGALTQDEKARLPKRLSNHAWDAIGIGLWCHGRFK